MTHSLPAPATIRPRPPNDSPWPRLPNKAKPEAIEVITEIPRSSGYLTRIWVDHKEQRLCLQLFQQTSAGVLPAGQAQRFRASDLQTLLEALWRGMWLLFTGRP